MAKKKSKNKPSKSRQKELNRLIKQHKAENPFHLPEGMTFTKEETSLGTVYNFRHRELGKLGRIVLQENMIGETHVSIEIAGDPDDPMTKKKEEIFGPVAMKVVKSMEKILGGGVPGTPAPQQPPEPGEMVLTKIYLCDNCGTKIALLIFPEDAIEEPELADCASKMYAKIKELNLPTWVIGPMMGDGPIENRPAPTLKVWPNKEPIQYLAPDAFNPTLEALSESHCAQPSSSKEEKKQKGGPFQAKGEPQWKPISFLPLISTLIDEDRKSGEDQYQSLLKAKDQPTVLDNALVDRIIRVHIEKLENFHLFEEQLARWQKEKLSKSQSKEIKRLEKELEKSKDVCEASLELAESLKKSSVDEILKESDLQAILDFFSGKLDLGFKEKRKGNSRAKEEDF